MQYSYLLRSWHHCTYNSTTYGAINLHTLQLASLYLKQLWLWCSIVTCLAVGITVPTTTLSLMQNSYIPYGCHHCTYKTLAQMKYSYIPCSWHHCTYNSTISVAIKLRTLQLASLYLQQHYLWYNSYIPYSWHHCTYKTLAPMKYSYFSCSWHQCIYNSTISDAVKLHTLQLESLYLQQH
jgi:hypothetical protein